MDPSKLMADVMRAAEAFQPVIDDLREVFQPAEPESSLLKRTLTYDHDSDLWRDEQGRPWTRSG